MLSRWRWIPISFSCLWLVGTMTAQTSARERTVIINGQSGRAMIYEINGRLYVDIQSLAQIANATLRLNGDEIVLTSNQQGQRPAPPAPAQNQGGSAGSGNAMSDKFMNAAIQDLALIKHWRSVLAYGVTKGVPGDGSRLVIEHDKSAEGLRLANVAVSTNGDQQAMQLLNNHFNSVNSWNDTLINQRRNMDTANYSMTENALSQDPTYQKIAACSDFLAKMLPSGQFSDDGACH